MPVEAMSMTYLCIWITWLVWVPTVLLEKKARGDPGSTSILPVIPLFPLVGCLAAWGLNQIVSQLGSYAIGGLHLMLLAAMLVSCAISGYRIRRRRADQKKNSISPFSSENLP